MELTQPTPRYIYIYIYIYTLLGMSVPNVINWLNKMGGVGGVCVCVLW